MSQLLTMRRFLAALLLLTFCVACSTGGTTTQAGTAVTPFPAPDFTLDTLSGGKLSLDSMHGRWVILNFWATWCAPCTSEMPALQTIANQLSGQVGLFGVNMREKADDIRTFMTRNHLSFPILLNPDDGTLAAYNLSVGIPQTVLITPKGQVVWHQYGPIDLNTFRTTFDQLRAAQS